MPETYTKEQIEEAKAQARFYVINGHLIPNECGAILLSALSAAKWERDENERKGKEPCVLSGNLMMERDALKARCAELEASGNALRFYIWLNKKTKDVAGNGQIRLAPPCVQAWDAIVGKKEG